MKTYSVAIRTLGTAGEKFKQELISLHKQSIMPEKIIVYIAEGYKRPDFTVGIEEYIWVKKGMIAQRALPYNEITSECIFLLDDDVEFATDSAERMLKAMEEYGADCVGADTFKNQEMTLKQKVFAAITNWVVPHSSSSKWAFKIHYHGSFSYNNSPQKPFYWSQSCAGPASLWKRDVLLTLRFEDESWLDSLGFAFGDDLVESYKLFANNYKLGVLYNSGINNLDAKTSSGNYQKNIQKFYIRSKASHIIWWRIIYNLPTRTRYDKFIISISYCLKCIWLLFVNCIASLSMKNLKIPYYYIKGIIDGITYTHSYEYKKIPPYFIKEGTSSNN